MDLKQASELSNEIVETLAPHCKQIMVCGSIRREKPFPGDIDIVLIPGNQGALLMALEGLGEKMKGGAKMIQRRYKGQQVDIYIADEKTWPTLVLIRTGSRDHNKYLCGKARAKGMILHADGSGIEYVSSSGEADRIIPKDEAHIFRILGLPYVDPRKRG
jgi:DNA polymerase/3'-5' exonuclease PolX